MSAPGLENGLKILEYVCNNGKGSFSEFKNKLSINGPSLSRFLKTLVDCGYLRKETSGYFPGYKVEKCAELVLRETDYKSISTFLLEEVSSVINNSVIWVDYLHGNRVCYDRFQKEDSIVMTAPGTVQNNILSNPADYIYLQSLPTKMRDKLFEKKHEDFKDKISKEDCLEFFQQAKDYDYVDDKGLIQEHCRRIAFRLPIDFGISVLIVAMIEGSYDQESIAKIIENVKAIINEYF
jgi:DNA-binding IclR family transcriptional regulator